jgi:hypothetical protein
MPADRRCAIMRAMRLPELLAVVSIEAIALLLLSRLLFVGVIASFADRRGKGFLLAVLRLPGNALHEFSHCLGFLLCGYRVKRVLLCIFDPRGRGSCTPGRAWSPLTLPQVAIGVSALMPLLVGSLALIAAARLLDIPAPAAAPLPGGDLLPQLWRQSLQLLHGLDPHHWQTYVFLYLALSIGAELAPSTTDLRYALPALLILAAGVWFTLFACDRATGLQALRHSLASGLGTGLLRLGSVLSLALVVVAAANVVSLIPGLMLQGLRAK